MLHRLCNLLGSLGMLLLAIGLASAQQPLAVRNATILTGTGQRIEGGTIVIRDGKISDIGSDIQIPVEARIIDAQGKYVMPGLVEAHTSDGLSQANETNDNVPYVTVIDGIDPADAYFRQARRNGVTTVRISPGNSTMIGGQAAVIKTGGTFIDDMVVDAFGGVKISLRPVNGSRMAHLAKLRKTLEDARRKLNKKADADDSSKAPEGKKDEESGEDTEKAAQEEEEAEKPEAAPVKSPEAQSELDKAMQALLTGKHQAILYCEKAMDVAQALRLVEEFKLRATLVLGRDCYKAVDAVAASKLPVILDADLVFWESDPRTEEETKVVLPEIFLAAGVPFVFEKNPPGSATIGSNYLWYQAATAVKYGMSMDDAITALTRRPAEFLGVDSFVGTLEKGKDGDLVILSGEPLKIGSWVEQTIINGDVVYRRDEDDQLKRLLTGETDDSQPHPAP